LLLSVRLIIWGSSKEAEGARGFGFERVRFPEAPRPTVGIVLDGRISATYRHISAHQNGNDKTNGITYLSIRWENIIAFRERCPRFYRFCGLVVEIAFI
jgi:hypothetical protein